MIDAVSDGQGEKLWRQDTHLSVAAQNGALGANSVDSSSGKTESRAEMIALLVAAESSVMP